MPNTKKHERSVVVTGDLTIDWHLARFGGFNKGAEAKNRWSTERTCVSWQCGGAALLADLVDAVAVGLRETGGISCPVLQPGVLKAPLDPSDGRFHHSYAIWSRFKYSEGARGGEKPVWRVQEFLGLDQSTIEQPGVWQKVSGDNRGAKLVILDDANIGFRDKPELWPAAVKKEGTPGWVLVKMAPPVAQGRLWEQLHEICSDRLIVVMTVNDLRRTEVQISRELSWERAAQDLFWELTHNPRVNALSHCRHVVVSFDTAGALLLSRHKATGRKQKDQKPEFTCTLFYDPTIVEGMWNQNYPGGMIGYTTCLTAGIARQIMIDPAEPDIPAGIQTGLGAVRFLHLTGYEGGCTTAGHGSLALPVNKIAAKLADSEKPFAVARVQDPVRFLTGPVPTGKSSCEPGFWTILEDRYVDSLYQVAQEVVLMGPQEALKGVPLGQFDKLITADRREIESFRSIRSLISEYCSQQQSRPLSIAVFGPPGSGKSFGVKQVASSICPGQIKTIEFNLSQLDGFDGLLDALHQVRDVALGGQIPLVFWDEFDTALDRQPLGWLRYFLAPMQDGSFQQGQVIHPIGRSIFVFAGGTCARMEDFTSVVDHDTFIKMKGPDFVSRLKGYVNILGPNPQVTGERKDDPYHVIRRAILFRSILQRTAGQIFTKEDGIAVPNIDSGVLRAFLLTDEYRHGARSMEAIVNMSRLADKSSYERSSLPPEAQLDLHVNGRDFLSLAQMIELTGELLEKLAEAAHEIYCENRKSDGWKYGAKKNAARKTTPLLVPYAKLPETFKEANRGTVRNIPRKLAEAGYVMIPSRSNEPILDFPGDDMEKLAKLEHQLWMKERLAAGFSLGEPTDTDVKLSPYLVSWQELPEKTRQIDRDLVSGIPRILARAGYAIVKVSGKYGNQHGC